MNWAIFNGDIVERSNAKVDIEDRGYQFGDGVYEVIRVYNGKMFAEQEHLQRFFRSTESIEIYVNYSNEQLTFLLSELINKNQLKEGFIYMQVTRGAAPRNHAFPAEKVEPALVAYTQEFERPVAALNSGVKTILTEDIRWLRCDIKSLNLLGNVLAKQKAAEHGCYEAVQHRGEIITEGSSSNVFMVKQGILRTHQNSNFILKGITKEIILKICSEQNIPFEERSFSVDDLKQADEVFLSSTGSEVMPIVEIDGVQVNRGTIGPVTRQLQQLFEEEIEKQCGVFTAI